MRPKKVFTILLALCTAAVMLAGCDSPVSGKPGSANAEAEKQVLVVPSLEEGESQQSIVFEGSGTLLYDRCGVSLTLTHADTITAAVSLNAKNTTDSTLSLRSMYIYTGDTFDTNDQQSLKLSLEGGESAKATLQLPKSKGVLRMRLYLIDENYSIVEGSLSDVITIEKSSLRKLPSTPLGRSVYEDENVKLVLTYTEYHDGLNTVYPYFSAYNKTDEDLYICQSEAVCEHSDYRFSLGAYLPANSRTDIIGMAYTSNKTLTAADLDSITFTLNEYTAEDHLMHPYSSDTLISAEGVRIVLDRTNRPEEQIPDRITPADSLDAYRTVLLEDDLTELPAPEDGEIVFENENVRIEYVMGAEGRLWSGDVCALGFKCTNKLKKQIRFDAIGTVNGATADFYFDESLPPMTEDYITLYYDMPDPEKFGGFADAEIMFTVEYDDGHSDENSFICAVPKMKIVTGERADTSGALDGSRLLYSDDNCELWLMDTRLKGKYAYLDLYILNKTDSPATIYVYDNSEDFYLYGAFDVFPQTCFVTEKYMRSMTGSDVTEKNVEDLTPEVRFKPIEIGTNGGEP